MCLFSVVAWRADVQFRVTQGSSEAFAAGCWRLRARQMIGAGDRYVWHRQTRCLGCCLLKKMWCAEGLPGREEGNVSECSEGRAAISQGARTAQVSGSELPMGRGACRLAVESVWPGRSSAQPVKGRPIGWSKQMRKLGIADRAGRAEVSVEGFRTLASMFILD